jgi:hypothetical protein
MDREKARRSVWQLRTVIPVLLAAVFLLDAGMRFLPIAPYTFRAWETLLRNRPPGAAFEPDQRYYNPRSYGDLASLGNFPDLRQYHPEGFTTDALGFRNDPRLLDAEVDTILAGDSFAVGSGVSDDQTLSSRLSSLTGCVIYNAGNEDDLVTPNEILSLARGLHMRSRLAIRLYSEDARIPGRPTRRALLTSTIVARTPARVRNLAGRLRGLLAVSPLRSLSGHAWKTVADDRILPNRYATSVVRATLDNGDTMLFQDAEVHNFFRKRPLSLDYWRWLRDDLQKARFDLLVILVPSKYRVYRSFLSNHGPADPEASDYLDRLESALRAMGIHVLNLTPVLSTEAATQYLEHHAYLYWLDDIHWNARGIALAADTIRKAWPPAEAPCGSPVARRPGG